jgi:hypothetical protein
MGSDLYMNPPRGERRVAYLGQYKLYHPDSRHGERWLVTGPSGFTVTTPDEGEARITQWALDRASRGMIVGARDPDGSFSDYDGPVPPQRPERRYFLRYNKLMDAYEVYRDAGEVMGTYHTHPAAVRQAVDHLNSLNGDA